MAYNWNISTSGEGFASATRFNRKQSRPSLNFNDPFFQSSGSLGLDSSLGSSGNYYRTTKTSYSSAGGGEPVFRQYYSSSYPDRQTAYSSPAYVDRYPNSSGLFSAGYAAQHLIKQTLKEETDESLSPETPLSATPQPHGAAKHKEFDFHSKARHQEPTIKEEPQIKSTNELILEAYRYKQYDHLKKLLTDYSADLYFPIRHHKYRLADVATVDGDLKTLLILKDLNYDFNRPGITNQTPLHYAVNNARTNSLKLLVKCSNPNLPFPNGEYPVHRACVVSVDVLSILLEEGCARCDLTIVDKLQNTALHRACLEDSADHVKLLLKHSNEAYINAQGYEGKTAIHIAAINQNRAILRMLLEKGAYIDIVSDNGKTVLDLIVSMDSTVLMTDLAQFFTTVVTESISATTLGDLTHCVNFKMFLHFLDAVDNEFQICKVPYIVMSVEEEDDLFDKLSTDNKIDMIEFSEVLLRILETDRIHCLLDKSQEDVLRKIASNVVRYVLYKEDIVLLERISQCGLVWTKILDIIEQSLNQVYIHTPDHGVNGIYSHFKELFIEKENGVMSLKRYKLVSFYGALCSNFKIEPYRDFSLDPEVKYMRHPMDTLTMWSILTGRLKLTESLLKQEKFDVVPLSLYSAAVLRAICKIRMIQVKQEAVLQLATNCEMFAKDAINKIFALDTSYKREVTVDFLLQPLLPYGNVSCIELAAKNDSANFLQTSCGQQALDKKWFGFLVYLNPFIREFIIWLGLVPCNVLVPMLLLYFDEKRKNAQKKHGAPPITEFSTYNDQCTFLLLEHNDHDKRRDSIHIRRPSNGSLISCKTESEVDAHASFFVPNNLTEEAKNKANNHSEKIKIKQDKLDMDNHSENASLLEPDVISIISSTGNLAYRRFTTFFQLLYQFYQIPAVKFRYHALSHIILLLFMSWVMLIDMRYEMDECEIIPYVIILGLLVEEIHEIIHHWNYKSMRSYLKSKWNLIDLSALSCSIVGISIRLTRLPYFTTTYMYNTTGVHFSPGSIEWQSMVKLTQHFDDDIWYTGRIFLGIATMLYWVRLLYISTVLEILGPKLKMIAKMISRDMFPFLFILFIFIFGFGVLIHGLLFPNGHRAWNPTPMRPMQVLMSMFKICFYSMVGDYSLDVITGSDQCDTLNQQKKFSDDDKCPHHIGRYLVPYIVLPLYVIVTELLLLNLIISLFSNTVMEIDARSKDLWQFERHELIEEFQSRSALPPPLNILDMLRKCVKYVLRRCNCYCNRLSHLDNFDQAMTLKYLLFQAFSLRNNRHRLMEETEEDEKMHKMRELIQEELLRARLMSPQNPTSPLDHPEHLPAERITDTRGTFLQSPPANPYGDYRNTDKNSDEFINREILKDNRSRFFESRGMPARSYELLRSNDSVRDATRPSLGSLTGLDGGDGGMGVTRSRSKVTLKPLKPTPAAREGSV